jgi:two-component system response regulator VanR
MATTKARAGTKTILVIDDDEDFRTTVRVVLEDAGYAVVAADSGRGGLDSLKRCTPDLVILDVMMETQTEGYGVSEAIKLSGEFQAFQNTPVIMVSSIQESPDELFPRAPEVDMIRPTRYLAKPLDIPKFLEVVRTLLPR